MTDQELTELLSETREIAVIGASPDTSRSSNSIARRLLNLGRNIHPVNPNYKMVLERPSLPTMQDLSHEIKVDIALIFRNPDDAPESVKDIITYSQDRGLKPVVWTQPGAHSEVSQNMAEAASLTYIGNQCIAVEYARLQLT